MPKTLEQIVKKDRAGRIKTIVAPSLLAADFADLKREMRKVQRAKCNWLHLDIMDGHFVPNITFGPPLVKSLREANKSLFFDCHLMVDEPLDFAKEFANAGAQMITIHAEASDNLPAAIRALRRLGVKTGVSIRPKTTLPCLDPVLHMVDLILIMTVEPGFGGQALIPRTLNKVRRLNLARKDNPKYEYLIQVDGGIDPTTAPLAVAAGSDVLVAGSSLFSVNGGDIMKNVESILNSAQQD